MLEGTQGARRRVGSKPPSPPVLDIPSTFRAYPLNRRERLLAKGLQLQTH